MLALTGCAPLNSPGVGEPPDLRPADVIGAGKAAGRGGVLVFTAGRFSGDDLGYMFAPFPHDLPDGFNQERDRAAGMGQWQLGTSLANPNGPNDTIRDPVLTRSW
jgi:hypothetical protein